MDIKVTCDVKQRIDFKKLIPIQGDLKSLSKENYDKLKKSIIKHGIHSPCFVWQDPNDGGKLKLLDGHQRCRAYGQMEKEGFKIPLIPIIKIEAENIKSAKEILLTLVSQYGHVEDQGLYEFIIESEIEHQKLNEYDLPGIIIENFNNNFFKEIDSKENKEKNKDKEFCPTCGK